MFKKNLGLFLIASTVLLGDSVDSQITAPYPETAPTKTYKTPTGTENPTDWKSSHYDMKLYIEKLNGGKESTGRGTQLMRDLGVTENVLKNPERKTVETATLKSSAEFKNIPSMTSFDKYNQQITSAAASNQTMSLNEESGQIRCYITRDIGFAYKCTKAGGLTYGGQINDDGTAAKNQCNADCYEGFACVAVANSTKFATTTEYITTAKNFTFTTSSLSKTFETTVDGSRKTSALTIKAQRTTVGGDETFYVDIYYKQPNSTEYLPLIKRAFFGKNNTETTLSIFDNVQALKVTIYTVATNLNGVTVSSLKTIHNDESGWICKSAQDISHLSPSAYSYDCPNGTVHSLTLTGGNTVKVCKNATSGGDNADGSYSSKAGCESICRQAYPCVPSFGTFSQDSLKSFREGCVGSNSACSDNPSGSGDASDVGDCKVARLTNAQIISEDVFDAYMDRTITVKDGVAIPGTDRPRVMDSDDSNSTRKNIEEWKDEAYANMQKEGTYTATKVSLSENTEASSAYGIGMSAGVDAGTLDPTQRTLYWKLKTKSQDALTNKQLFFYAIADVALEYYGYDENGKMMPKRDRILYIKTSSNDTFKPIRRTVEYAKVDLNDKMLPVEVKNAYATPQYQTFSGSSWMALSQNQVAEAFKASKITVLSPYEMIPVITNMSSFYNTIPGIVRRIVKDGPTETKYYTGDWGSGRQAIARYSIYTWYSTTTKTYSELVNEIENETVQPIYNSVNVPHFSKEIQHDGSKDMSKEVEVYKFGNVNKLSAYVRIRPKTTDIGKTGFVFVFVY